MFDWGEFLTQAHGLASDGAEAGHRSAVSRAYYAVFGLARRRLRDTDGCNVPTTGQAHRFVWDEFNASADEDRQRIGITGNRLRRARNQADYDDAIADAGELSESALADAHVLAELLQAL